MRILRPLRYRLALRPRRRRAIRWLKPIRVRRRRPFPPLSCRQLQGRRHCPQAWRHRPPRPSSPLASLLRQSLLRPPLAPSHPRQPDEPVAMRPDVRTGSAATRKAAANIDTDASVTDAASADAVADLTLPIPVATPAASHSAVSASTVASPPPIAPPVSLPPAAPTARSILPNRAHGSTASRTTSPRPATRRARCALVSPRSISARCRSNCCAAPRAPR